MIFDEKKNLNFYRNLGIEGRYAKAVDFLLNTVEYTTVPWEEAKFEAHEHYTDIQYVIKGTEAMTYAPVGEMTVTTPYNPDKDVVFFDNSNPGIKLPAKEDQYAIFFPWDAHKPKAANGQPAPLKKVIVKIKED